MRDLITFEPGTLGLRAVIRGPWGHSISDELRRREINELELNSGKGWQGQDISFLSHFPMLRGLRILDQTLRNVEPIHELKRLEVLHLNAYFKTRIRLDTFKHLRECVLEWGEGAESLFECMMLESLFVNRYPGPTIEPFLHLGALQDLAIYSSPLASLELIGRLTRLRRLRLALLRKLSSLHGIEDLKGLRELTITTCRRITGIGPVAALTSLEILHLDNCGILDSLHPVSGLTRLRTLTFAGSTNIRDGDLSPIKNLLALDYLAFQSRPHYTHQREHFADPSTGKVHQAPGRA